MFDFLAKETLSFLPDVTSLPLAILTGPRSWPSQITARSTSVTSLERKILTANLPSRANSKQHWGIRWRARCVHRDHTNLMKQNCCSHTDVLSSKHIFKNFSQILHVCWESVAKKFFTIILSSRAVMLSVTTPGVSLFSLVDQNKHSDGDRCCCVEGRFDAW